MAKSKQNAIDFPFYRIMWQFYSANKKEIRKSYTNLTRTILANAEPSKENPNKFLRKPQYEAFEIYVFLKEYLGNPRLADLFNAWYKNKSVAEPSRMVAERSRSIPFTFDNSRFYGEDNLFSELDTIRKKSSTQKKCTAQADLNTCSFRQNTPT